jgi:GNAT superfamily N-acetyltransferase
VTEVNGVERTTTFPWFTICHMGGWFRWYLSGSFDSHATEQEGVIDYQTRDLWVPTLDSMAHVGQLGTFLRPEWRRQGIGEALFRGALDFARERDF